MISCRGGSFPALVCDLYTVDDGGYSQYCDRLWLSGSPDQSITITMAALHTATCPTDAASSFSLTHTYRHGNLRQWLNEDMTS